VARLFGTDGIRGVVGEDLTEELCRRIGAAAVSALGHRSEGKTSFLIGRDTRGSGDMLAAAIAEGVRSAGGDVLIAGVQTTPAIAFLTTDLRASAGVVISASHNPPEFNGVKFFGPSGFKLADDIEDEIEAHLDSRPEVTTRGESHPVEDGIERYLEHLVTGAQRRLDGLRVVVDCANGAASSVAPEALRRLGADVSVMFDGPNGDNINDGCGALHPDVVAAETSRLGADAGVAHDGDADRALFSDAEGNVVDGDQVLAACAIAAKRDGDLAQNTVVSTVMANLGFMRAMQEAGIDVVRAKVGDRYVLEEMIRTGAKLGGEQSGHVIFADQATTGDGIVTAIRFLSLVAAGSSVEELAGVMKRFPQVLENVRVSDRGALEGSGPVRAAIDEAEGALGDRGRVLVRASGTEPLVRVMVEAETEEEAAEHAARLCEVVRASLG
jgi:phosphoglucosamine mutase